MFPQTASSGAETSTAVRLIKPWQELLLDYFSILGIATGTFGIYAISLNAAAESVQCVPGEILQNISYYTSLKDYVNGVFTKRPDEKDNWLSIFLISSVVCYWHPATLAQDSTSQRKARSFLRVRRERNLWGDEAVRVE